MSDDEQRSMQWAVLFLLVTVSALFFVGIITELDYWKDLCLK